ncbi:peflin-like [Paramacrobiotus metropolitanus]|uniref:peflin-like n=1 Tax=Paramacrobiotus metropolitanus TaxID=2943436 RepID=UPI0024456B6B|nr:peflin-like [Paramacrobiotus metropolitanus]
MGNDYSTHMIGGRPTYHPPHARSGGANERIPKPRPSYAATPSSTDAPPSYDDLFGGPPQSFGSPPEPFASPPGSARSTKSKSNADYYQYPTPPPSTGHYSGASASPRPSWRQPDPVPAYNAPHGYASAPPRSLVHNAQEQEDEEELRTWFAAIDESNDGHISAQELRQALLNDNFTPFHEDTVKMMLKMFDKDMNSQIEFSEFAGLKRYILEWKKTFDQHDSDHSGSIDVDEIAHALSTMGYTFSHNFCKVLCKRFSSKTGARMDLDAFIYACAMINALAKEYRKKFRTEFLEEYVLKKL